MIHISNLIIAYKKLLAKPIWSCSDIQEYLDCGRTKASQIKARALKIGGVVRGIPSKVKKDAVLEVLGLDFEDEIKKLNKLEE